MTTARSRAVELVDRFIDAGANDAEACEWVRQMLARQRRTDGAVPFATVAHLPVTPAGWAAVRRDNALRAAAAAVCTSTTTRARARELEVALARAVSRGTYARWRAAGDSRRPDALLLAIDLHGGEVPSLSTLRRALDEAGSQKPAFLAAPEPQTAAS